ncbi:MAG: hypothetical protein HYY52_01345 [Candidatus Melainabacteria bacterium]|nr:hypothetical protein [Candidatus Melainabacteria bacterium]
MVDEKVKQIINNHITYAQKFILDHKKEFSSWSTIYHRFIKKDKVDYVMDYTKEIIKRMERDKTSSQTAMQITEVLMPEMQGMKKEIILTVLPLTLGFILLIVFSFLFSFTRPFNFTNPFLIYYSIGIFIGSILFGLGLVLRKKMKLKTLTRTMLFQAAMAYGASKMQGQGSFGAFRILEEMKTKQGKELQIRITQPKIMYK